MPYQVHWSEQTVIVAYQGQIDIDELTRSEQEIQSDQRFDELRKWVNDFSATEQLNVSDHDIKLFAHLHRAARLSNPQIALATVSDGESLRQQTALYEKTLGDEHKLIKTFSQLENALRWQG